MQRINRLIEAIETAIDELDPTSCVSRDEVAEKLLATLAKDRLAQ